MNIKFFPKQRRRKMPKFFLLLSLIEERSRHFLSDKRIFIRFAVFSLHLSHKYIYVLLTTLVAYNLYYKKIETLEMISTLGPVAPTASNFNLYFHIQRRCFIFFHPTFTSQRCLNRIKIARHFESTSTFSLSLILSLPLQIRVKSQRICENYDDDSPRQTSWRKLKAVSHTGREKRVQCTFLDVPRTEQKKEREIQML